MNPAEMERGALMRVLDPPWAEPYPDAGAAALKPVFWISRGLRVGRPAAAGFTPWIRDVIGMLEPAWRPRIVAYRERHDYDEPSGLLVAHYVLYAPSEGAAA